MPKKVVKIVLHIEVPEDFNRKDEGALDDALSDLIYEKEYELVSSEKYENVTYLYAE